MEPASQQKHSSIIKTVKTGKTSNNTSRVDVGLESQVSCPGLEKTFLGHLQTMGTVQFYVALLQIWTNLTKLAMGGGH